MGHAYNNCQMLVTLPMHFPSQDLIRSNEKNVVFLFPNARKQVAQWETIPHLGDSIMYGDTIIYAAQKADNSELETVIRNKFKHLRYYASSGNLQVLKSSEQKL